MSRRDIATRLPHPLLSIVFLTSFVGYMLFGLTPFENPDVSWHVAAGQWMLAHKQIPLHDPWSFTAGDAPWYNLSWLWDIALAALFNLGGTSAMYIMAATLGAATVTLLAYTLRARGDIADHYILRCCALAALVQWYGLFPQPQLASFFLVVLFQHLLHTRRTRWLPALMLLWVNLHGGFFIGLLLVSCYAVAAWLNKDSTEFHRLCLSGLCCALACLFTPWGIHLGQAVMDTLASPMRTYITEWYSFTFGREVFLSIFLLVFILCSNARAADILLADKIIAGVGLVAGLTARRDFLFFAFMAAPYLAYNMQSLMRAMRSNNQTEMLPNGWRAPTAVMAGIVFLLVVFSGTRLIAHDKLTTDPYGVGDALKALHGEHVKFLNDYNLGGQLIFYSEGSWPVFIDTRGDTAYGTAFMQGYMPFLKAEPEAEALLKRYDIGGLILLKNHAYAATLPYRTDWHEVFHNDRVVAYVRNK